MDSKQLKEVQNEQFQEISETEVMKELKKLELKKAAPIENILTKTLKDFTNTFVNRYLLQLIPVFDAVFF